MDEIAENRNMKSAETQPIGAEALISKPALKPLTFLIGSWRSEGTHPDVPDTTFHGRTSFQLTCRRDRSENGDVWQDDLSLTDTRVP